VLDGQVADPRARARDLDEHVEPRLAGSSRRTVTTASAAR
jgi:hypothetical protein